MSFRQITAMAVLALASISSAQKGVEKPAQQPTLNADTVAGCFSSLADMKLNATYKFNAQSWCVTQCRKMGKLVGATYSQNCYCGTLLPNNKTLLDDSKCNEPCPGYDTEACGGLKAYTVYNIGIQVNVAEADDDTTSTSTAPVATSTTTAPALDTAEPTTTPSATPSPTAQSEPKSNKVGIAVGVVVGVLAVSSIAAGLFFFVRRKRNTALEEEHRRNAAVNAFISGGKPPGSSGGMSMADSRMDPVLNRRLSDGSIADNQDYSRRILRVTNA